MQFHATLFLIYFALSCACMLLAIGIWLFGACDMLWQGISRTTGRPAGGRRYLLRFFIVFVSFGGFGFLAVTFQELHRSLLFAGVKQVVSPETLQRWPVNRLIEE